MCIQFNIHTIYDGSAFAECRPIAIVVGSMDVLLCTLYVRINTFNKRVTDI